MLINPSTQTLLAPASGASKGLRISQDSGSCLLLLNSYYSKEFTPFTP